MIRSMTGFGAATVEDSSGRYAIEIRSVNNKFFKVSVRLPEELAVLESDLEGMIGKRLRRGSVTVTGRFTPSSKVLAGRINPDAAQAAVRELLAAVPDDLRDRTTVEIGSLLSAPGVLQQEADEDLVDQAREVLSKLVTEACDKLVDMRVREGETVHDDLAVFGQRMSELLKVVAERAPLVVEAYQERLHARVNALLEEAGTKLDQGDLIREVAIFAERSDIAEEVNRLGGHLEQYSDLLATDGGEPVGRTLDFLAQEMLREANTIASKSADVDISRTVVEIKGLIDRIKEQAQNVE